MYGIIFLLVTMPLFCAADFVKALPKGVIFTNAVVNQLLQVNQLRARNVIISGDLVVEGSIINGSGSSSGGSGSSGIQTIDGNSGSVTGTTVTIAGGNNIITSGAGTTLTVSVSGTTDNAVQIGNASGSLSSVALGTTGEVLTSNGPGAAPTFQSPGAVAISITGDSGGPLMGSSFTFTGVPTGLTFTGAGTTETLGGTLVVTNGGTGRATLTNHGVLVGAGTAAVTQLAVGPADTVLLGNANADPSFGTVPNAALNFSSITLANGTGITVTGSPVSLGGTATISLNTPVSIANGGTNATSMTNTDGVVYYDGSKLNTTLVGTVGEVLTSNGTGVAPTFQNPAASSISITGDNAVTLTGNSFTFTGGTTGLTFNGAGTTETLGGTLAIANGGTNATSMANDEGVVYYDGSKLNTTLVGTVGEVLTSGGTGVAPSFQPAAASSISITGDNAVMLTGNSFTFTGGTTGLKFNGAGTTETLGGTLAIANGGTNATSMANTDGVVYYDGSKLNTTLVGTVGEVLTSGGTGVAPSFQPAAASSISITGDNAVTLTGNSFTFTGGTTGLKFNGAGTTETLGGTLAIANGGTNATSMANTDGVVYYDGSKLNTTLVGTVGEVLTSSGTGVAPSFQPAAASSISITGDNAVTLTGNSFTFTGGTTGLKFNGAGTTETLGGTLAIANGGTNATSMANTDGVVYYDGSKLNTTLVGTVGEVLTSGGTGVAPSFQPAAASSISITGDNAVTLTGNSFTFTGGTTGLKFNGAGTTETLGGTLAIANGGTNATSMANTDGVVYYDGSKLNTTLVGTVGEVLTSSGTGVAPSFQPAAASSISITGDNAVTLTGNSFTFTGGTTGLKFNGAGTTETLGGTLAIANGGTNATSMANTDGVVYYDGSKLNTTLVGTVGEVLTSGGTGVAPSFQPAVGITTIDGNSGSITGSTTVTIQVHNNPFASTEGTVNFISSGTTSNLNFTDPSINVAVGVGGLGHLTSGSSNTAFGGFALAAVTSGTQNVAVGTGCASNLTSGSNNVAVGYIALNGSGFTGSSNISVGMDSSSEYTGTESNNIVIGTGITGTTGESNKIRIGIGTTTAITGTFIGGISGVASTSGVAVLINSSGQLGTTTSSKRYKDNIKLMDDSFSERILRLEPATFIYKVDETKALSWGLIAEEVHEVFPELVVFSKEGLPETVRYHELPVLLLNEMKKMQKKIACYQEEVVRLAALVDKLIHA